MRAIESGRREWARRAVTASVWLAALVAGALFAAAPAGAGVDGTAEVAETVAGDELAASITSHTGADAAGESASANGSGDDSNEITSWVGLFIGIVGALVLVVTGVLLWKRSTGDGADSGAGSGADSGEGSD